MIVLDTSALVAIAMREPQAQACMEAMVGSDMLLMSAGTLTELLIIAARRNFAQDVSQLLTDLNVEVVPVTQFSAQRAAQAYQRWGKGNHPAKLNYGDCFAYELATSRHCPLLYVGQDFAQTDVQSAL